MPAAIRHPAPDASGTAGRPARTAGPGQRPGHPAALRDDDRALLADPFLGGPEQSEVLDWEWAALSHEEDPSATYPDEDESGDHEEWLEEVSYVLAALSVPAAAHTGLVSRAAGSGAADPDRASPDPACPDRRCADSASSEPALASPSPRDLPGPRDFAVGSAADTMVPGPELAALADQMWHQGLTGLDDDQLTGVLQAANRLAAWSAALRVAAVSGLAARRETAGRESGDWRPFDHVDDEVAVALTLTRRSAARLLDLALALDRLPLTRAALSAGLIDERRAEVIAEELSGLDDAHAAAVEKLIIGKAPGLTSGQLRALVRRAVLSADPKAARKRKEAALKDARVEMFPETSGTAALSGRDLPPAAALAADKHLTALAQALKAAGIPGTLDTLRARAYLHLLSGQPASTLILQSASPGRPGREPPGRPGREPPPGPGADTHGPAESGGTASGGTAPGTAPPSSAPPGTACPSPDPRPGGLPGLHGSVNLTMPLSAWLGWTQSPGDVPGYGPIDADDSRTLADLLGRNPASQWCVTLTDRAGHPVAHACAPRGPRPRPGPGPPDPGTSASPGDGPPATGPTRHRTAGLATRPDLRDTGNPGLHPPERITRLPAQPHPAAPDRGPQPHLHRTGLPPQRHPLRPRPRHPLRPGRPDL